MLEGHGDDLYRYEWPVEANFSSNVPDLPRCPGLKRRLTECMERIDRYPEPDARSLADRLAARHGIEPGSVCVTAGATEAFYLIAAAFPASVSLVVTPSFAEYEDACRMHGHRIAYCTADELSRGAPDGTGLVWIGNPNNPDGRVIPERTLAALIGAHPGRIFVLDHSYEAFTDRPLTDTAEATRQPNTIVVHSMTKRYGVAGLRLGYATATPRLVQRLQACRMPWTVGTPAAEAGKYILSHPDEFPFDLKACLTETQRFRASLDRIGGIRTRPTDCHFFLAELERGTAAELKEYLIREHGILIRDASNFRGLGPRCIRLSSRRREQNDRLVDAIAEWMRLGN